jgi:thiamine biosynthesis lipoprotein
MRRWIASGLVLGIVAGSGAGCGAGDDALTEFRLYVMATVFDLSLPAGAVREDPGLLPAIESELRAFEIDYYPWSDGELAALNRALSNGDSFTVSAPLAGVLRRSREIATLSDGAFEPGVGPLVELWGFNDGLLDAVAVPAAADIDAVLAASGSIRDLTFDGITVAAPEAHYVLDLGGSAKGAAVDRIVDRLAAAGVERALINAGGDLRVIGEPPDRHWRIGILAPRGDGLLGTVTLQAGEAAFSSGDYERFFEQDGERFHHILDPRTGRPVGHTRAVTVVAADGLLADAAATALFVAGPEDWRAMASRLGVTAVLRVESAGRIEMSAGMRDRFQAGSGEASDIIAAGD